MAKSAARLRKIPADLEAKEEAEKAANTGYRAEKAANTGYKLNSHGNNNTNYGGVNNNSRAYSVHGNSTSTSNKYDASVMNNNCQFHGDGNGGVIYGGFNASKNYH